MSTFTTRLAQPSTLAALAVFGSAAFYFGLKTKAAKAKQERRQYNNAKADGQNSSDNAKGFGVPPGRSGGGV